jgi:hypothetical protein
VLSEQTHGTRLELHQWDRERFRVVNPKTGRAMRDHLPEEAPYLREAFELAEPSAVHVITRRRDTEANPGPRS